MNVNVTVNERLRHFNLLRWASKITGRVETLLVNANEQLRGVPVRWLHLYFDKKECV